MAPVLPPTVWPGGSQPGSPSKVVTETLPAGDDWEPRDVALLKCGWLPPTPKPSSVPSSAGGSLRGGLIATQTPLWAWCCPPVTCPQVSGPQPVLHGARLRASAWVLRGEMKRGTCGGQDGSGRWCRGAGAVVDGSPPVFSKRDGPELPAFLPRAL